MRADACATARSSSSPPFNVVILPRNMTCGLAGAGDWWLASLVEKRPLTWIFAGSAPLLTNSCRMCSLATTKAAYLGNSERCVSDHRQLLQKARGLSLPQRRGKYIARQPAPYARLHGEAVGQARVFRPL